MSSHETEFDAVVVARAHTADSIDVFELARADASTLPAWQPGAHIDLVLPSGDGRQYWLLRYALHYAGRSRSALALVDEIGAVTLHLSDEGTRLDVPALLGSLDPMAAIYACGPTRFIEAVETSAGGHPLHVERFEAQALGDPVLEGDFEVELALSGESLTVPPDRSILEVVEEAGVFVLSSCR